MNSHRCAILLVFGLCSLAGCLPVPVPGTPRPYAGGLRPEEKIGTSQRKPLRVALSDRERTVAVLGPPRELTLDGRTLVYGYNVVTSRTLWFFPFAVTATPNTRDRYLCLRYDDRGVLSSFKVYDDWSGMNGATGHGRLVSYPSYRGQTRDLRLPPVSPDTDEE